MVLRPERQTLLMVLAGTRHRDAGLDRGLARRDLALAGQEDLAHEHVVDLVGGDAGPAQGLGDGESAQVHGREAGQRTRELPDGRASPCDDDGLGHSCTSGFPPVWLPVGNPIVPGHYRRVT